MSHEVKISPDVLSFFDQNNSKKVNLYLVLGLYRDEKITIRQAAKLLNVSYREMQDILAENKIFIDFGDEEIEEELTYGLSGE